MKKALLLAPLLIGTLLNAEAEIGRESYLKTKEIYLLSQVHPNFEVDLALETGGVESGVFTIFDKKVPDNEWYVSIYVDAENNTCVNHEDIVRWEKNGIKVKSLVADNTIASLREALKRLKEEGAKYIAVDASARVENPANQNKNPNGNFSMYLSDLLAEPEQYRFIWKHSNPQCSRKKESALKETLFGLGTIAAIAVGVQGGASGSAEMVSFAGNAVHAIDNTAGMMNSDGVGRKNKEKTFAYKTSNFRIFGVKENLYSKRLKDEYIEEGYIFPIEEVEKELNRYMKIPYRVAKDKRQGSMY